MGKLETARIKNNCICPHPGTAGLWEGCEFYVEREGSSGEFLGSLFPLSVYKIPFNLPAFISQMRMLEAAMVTHPNSHNKRRKPSLNCFNVCKSYRTGQP